MTVQKGALYMRVPRPSLPLSLNDMAPVLDGMSIVDSSTYNATYNNFTISEVKSCSNQVDGLPVYIKFAIPIAGTSTSSYDLRVLLTLPQFLYSAPLCYARSRT